MLLGSFWRVFSHWVLNFKFWCWKHLIKEIVYLCGFTRNEPLSFLDFFVKGFGTDLNYFEIYKLPSVLVKK